MNIGLALSGGGFRGIAHIGVIKALEEHNIFPDHIAGTSAGAIVGALYANGNTWEEILDFFKLTEVFSINKFALRKPGFIDTEKMYDSFKNILGIDDFSVLKKQLYITATNLVDGTLQVFHEGELIKPILASAAFPAIFTPIKIGEAHYIDGGTLNNFPVDLISGQCDKMIGVYVNPFEKKDMKDLKHSFSVLERAYRIRSAYDSISKFKDCDLVICPEELKKVGTFTARDMDAIFNLGYEAAKAKLTNENVASILLNTDASEGREK
ncbi:patatin-like phospholipase family protein [Maribacter polysiphoniae]|uniref:NTE family protein n=1 Tax=Maribacter polysiphoniae TaxID=429344 RepID=A0A316E7E2_9FLAO|nr:patatin-like phospholipase family protein [Maribacter polysiphoniae]MBD1259077.1 patatin-like phospholipase family protein [Maribacter polysiphoniae]PWK24633.1 NTE family protein [Maribacter polysiphoniae]